MRRLAADELGLPTVPFWFAGSVEELTAVAEHAGFPLVVQAGRGCAGRGPVGAAAHRRRRGGLAARGGGGPGPAQPGDRRDRRRGRLRDHPAHGADHRADRARACTSASRSATARSTATCWRHGSRSSCPPAALDAAKSIAARIVNSLGGRGVFGVELLVRGDEVYFADVRTRPHDSGLVTLRSQRLSEFELHARAILGLHVDTIMISPGAAEVTYAGAESAPVDIAPENVNAVLGEALAVAESDVRLFNRPDEPTAASTRAGAGHRARCDDRQGQGAPGVRRAAQTLVPCRPTTADEPRDRPTMAPFLGALAIIVLVVIAIWLFNRFRAATAPPRPAGRPGRGRPERRAAAARTSPTSAPTPARTCAAPRPMCLRANGIRWPSAVRASSTTSPT